MLRGEAPTADAVGISSEARTLGATGLRQWLELASICHILKCVCYWNDDDRVGLYGCSHPGSFPDVLVELLQFVRFPHLGEELREAVAPFAKDARIRSCQVQRYAALVS